MTETMVTQATAKSLGLLHYFTGKPCKRGHISKRYTNSRGCLACAMRPDRRAYAREWVEENRETVREYHRKFARTDKGHSNTKRKNASPRSKAWRTEWQARYRERANEATRRHYWKNVDAAREKQKAKHKANPAWSRSRERRMKQATPSWVDRQAIIAIYAACPPSYEVDHIVPIMGRLVCGLHVPWNLQYLPKRENRSKSNRHA